MRSALLVIVLFGASGACKKPSAEPAALDDPTPQCKATLTAEQSRAFEAGLASLTGNDHVRSHGSEPAITFYRSDNNFVTGLASKCAVADAFVSAGQQAMDDPRAAVLRILLDFRTRPQPGMLYAKADWYAEKVDDMTDDQFTMHVAKVLGDCRGGAGYGFIERRIGERVDKPLTNMFMVYAGRVLEELRRGGAGHSAPSIEQLKPIVKKMAKAEISGAMWEHPPQQSERDEIVRCIDRGPYVKPSH